MAQIIIVIISRRTYWHRMLLLDAQCSIGSRERRESHLVNEVRLGKRRAPGGAWKYGSLIGETDFGSSPKYAAWALAEVTLLSLSFSSITWE